MQQDLINQLHQATTIYFVCSGNIIRSAYAELLARHLGLDHVASYGTTYRNRRIHRRSAAELQKQQVNQSLIDEFSPTYISEAQPFDPQDLHIVMTEKHRQQLLAAGIDASKIVKITAYIDESGDVADPYFNDNWEEAYRQIGQAVHQITTELSGDL